MFRKLYNEVLISYEVKIESPLFIRSGLEEGLSPTAADHSYITTHREGKVIPFIPGTSLKGVFRTRAEKLLWGSCDIFSNACGREAKKGRDGAERYKKSCPACKLFGSTAIKSRIQFSDAYPVGEFKVGRRTNVAIDRITGAAKNNALFDLEYIEEAKFKGEIKFQNFFKWQIKTLIQIFKDMEEGYVTLGGLTSKGFGRLSLKDISLKVRYYDRSKKYEGYEDEGYYVEKTLNTLEEIEACLKDTALEKKELERWNFDEQAI